MKKAAVVLASILSAILLVGLSFASEIPVDSKIVQVTVYPDSALISRQATVRLNMGEQAVVFSDIIPDVDENSLRVSSDNLADVKILGAKLKKEYLKDDPSEKIKSINEQIQKVKDEIKALENNKFILSEEKKFLDSINLFSKGQIPKDLMTRMPLVADLDATYKFIDTKLRENLALLMDADLKIRELKKRQDVLERELAQISGPTTKLKRSIIVDLEVLKAVDCSLTISYLVSGAMWQPIYDARANFAKSEVELVCYGLITQNTGEPWQDVEVTLSTAKPSIGGSMPEIYPWFVKPYQPPRKEMRSQVARYKAVNGAALYDKMDSEDSVALEALAPAGIAKQEYASVEEKGIAVVYKLPNKATIESNGLENKLAVISQVLKSDFEYSSYPRAVTLAYLGSKVDNSKGLQLLSGRVNIFLDGDFVGSSFINNIGPGENFDLYLGADENVKVKREQLDAKVDQTLIGGILSATKRVDYKYKLTVENYKSKDIKVKLFEAIPVPQDDRIKVRIETVSLEPKQKDYKDKKGVWLWELQLAPKEKKEITYTCIVEYPREMQVEGL